MKVAINYFRGRMNKVNNWWVPEYDRYSKEAILNRRIKLYEEQAEMLKKHIRHTDLYVDIGANFGHTAVPFASMFKKIICFEITPTNYECLVKNTEAYPNIQCMNVGLSNIAGKVDIMEYPTAGSVNAIIETKFARSEKGNVVQRHVVPLDYLLPYETAGFIKIDVEGHEVQVIEGAQEFLTRSRGLCFIESVETKEAVKEAMFKLGWKYILRNGFHDLIFKKKA
jgi:FkbM family methyltransferase